MFSFSNFSFFAYDQNSINERDEECFNYPTQCKDEKYYYREINGQLHEKFGVGFDLPIVFIDSYSQTKGHIDDLTEQMYYDVETSKLWEFATQHDDFRFKTIDEILIENEEMRREIVRLNDVITNNITELSLRLDAETEDRIGIFLMID